MKNALEGATRSIYRGLRKQQPAFCACQQCEDDVVALALNQIRPRYVSGHSAVGEVVTGVNLSLDQMRAELTVLVLDAMKKVGKEPRHAPSGPSAPGSPGGAGGA